MKYRHLFPPLITGLLLSSTIVSQAKEINITRDPYVQLSTESSQVVVWRTDGEMKPVVRIGTSLDKLNFSEEKILVKQREHLWQGPEAKSAPENTMQYEAYLSDLQPDTTYYYAFIMGTRESLPLIKVIISKHTLKEELRQSLDSGS